MTLSPLERETLALLPATRQQIAARLVLTMSAACQRIQALAGRGLVTGERGPVERTPAGDEALRACPAPVSLPAPLGDEALPARVAASQTGLRLLRHLVEETRAGRRVTFKTASAAIGVCASAVTTLVVSLVEAGLVEVDATLSTRHRRALPTALGVAVAEGRVPVVSHQLLRAERRWGRRIETSAPRAARAAKPCRTAEDVRAAVERVQVRPAPAPPPAPPLVVRELADVGPLPPPVPPGLDVNAPRPIRHPALPAPAPRDPRFSESRWRHLTTPKQSWTHNACAEGRA